ncbi:helix-turn-helix transcriptional regulator [Leisingera caerulea]|uniref:helix-turn-helix transcriptional regulator n=1 Tax=Leisingera caerulea TaxID=506591 RepID=UPI00040D5F82|nr:helix-turn-helix transcriptional regulator [Leisingera caerulea]
MISIDRFSNALSSIYDAAYSTNRWSDAMEACRRATAAKHVVHYAYGEYDEIRFSTRGGSPSLKSIEWLFEEYNRRFREKGVTGYDDVGAAYMRTSSVGSPVLDTDIWDLEWIEGRPEVVFVRGQTGIFRRLYLNTSVDPLINAGVQFYYDEAHSEIPREDVVAAGILGPHLAKAFDIARWAQNLRAKYDAVLGALNKIDLGICVTDRFGRVAVCNTAAKDICAEKDGIWRDLRGNLVTIDPEKTAAISQAVQNIAQTSEGKGGASAVELSIPRRGSDHPLLLIVSPLRDADVELERGFFGSLITIIDADRISDLRIDLFGDAYGFTPMEKKAASLLVSGLTTPEIGEALGVAASTATSHVKSVMKKTLSDNRVKFTWRALQFTPPIL